MSTKLGPTAASSLLSCHLSKPNKNSQFFFFFFQDPITRQISPPKMASSKADDYYPIPPQQPPQNYVVLPVYLPLENRRTQRRRIICSATFLLLAVAVYTVWPSEPDLKVVRIRIDRLHIHTSPVISLDVTLGLTVKVRNVDVYSLNYSSLVVSIGYRGKKLGFVTSDGGYVSARGPSYVDATLELDGVEVLSDVILLFEDLARGSIPFDTVTEVRGQLGLYFFEVPLKAKVSCEVYVNPGNQTLVRQNCYPE